MALEINPENTRLPHPSNEATRLFVFVGGSSESGKSELTSTAYATGMANRVKYLRVANELGASLYQNDDPFDFLSPDNQDIETRYSLFWKQLDVLAENHRRVTFIETIKHPGLLRSFGSAAVNAELLTIFVDADFNKRVRREASRLNVSPEDIRPIVEAKDAAKNFMGLDEVRELANITVNNDGTHEEYKHWVNTLIQNLDDTFPSDDSKDAILYE